jgi:two-component system, NarL family, nitrate/nitrite response regulator NarL
MSRSGGLRVRLRAADTVRSQGLAAMLQAAGHTIVEEAPDVTLCDVDQEIRETEAPAVVLTDRASLPGPPAGMLASTATADQIDAAVRAVAAGLLVRSPGRSAERGFAPAEDAPLLTPREREILGLVGQGMSNKTIARHLGISVHTVKFHLEALFLKLDATSRAEAVAKGLTGGVIEL